MGIKTIKGGGELIMSLPTGLKQIEIEENVPRHKCGHCGNEGCADLIAEFISNQKSSEDEYYVEDWTTWYIYYCPVCNNITVKSEYQFSEDSYTDYDGNTILNKKIEILYPLENNGVPMNQYMPKEMINDYEEAEAVSGISPRSAAALLRLLLEKLCRKYLSEIGKIKGSEKLNQMIGILVKEGISDSIQKACDILRITGNETVHAGIIDIRDNLESVKFLFELVNMIADELHLRCKKIPETYEKLPQEKLDGIQNRDK